MKLENYEVHLPNYSIGDRIYDKIGPVCESYGKKVLVIGGRKALDAAYEKICSYVEKTDLQIIGKKSTGRTVHMPQWSICAACRSIRKRTWCSESAAARRWIR